MRMLLVAVATVALAAPAFAGGQTGHTYGGNMGGHQNMGGYQHQSNSGGHFSSSFSNGPVTAHASSSSASTSHSTACSNGSCNPTASAYGGAVKNSGNSYNHNVAQGGSASTGPISVTVGQNGFNASDLISPLLLFGLFNQPRQVVEEAPPPEGRPGRMYCYRPRGDDKGAVCRKLRPGEDP